jgi:hypothetical protein
MPVPEGVITTSQTTEPEEKQDDLSDVQGSSGDEQSGEDEGSEETTQEV